MSKYTFSSYFEYIASYEDLCEFLCDKISENHDENTKTINGYGKFHYEIIGIDQLENGSRIYTKFDAWNYIANFPENAYQFYDPTSKILDREKVFYNYITVGYPNKFKIIKYENPRAIVEATINLI